MSGPLFPAVGTGHRLESLAANNYQNRVQLVRAFDFLGDVLTRSQSGN